MRLHTIGLSVPCALLLGMPLMAQVPGRAAVIWHDRSGVAALELVDGPERGPGTTFTFIKESTNGTSPKFEVRDEHGTTWKVKLGEEAKSETAATRLLWAAGYVVELGYYRPQIVVMGLPKLDRGRKFVSDGGIVAGARLEREANGGTTTWSWYDNPFIGTREFNGLRVMMALINNWDLKEVNNRAPDASNADGQYGITDLGATFGRTGNAFTRSKGVVDDYADARFVEKVSPTHVDLVMHSRPSFLAFFMRTNYRVRTRMESVAKQIPIADARWIGGRLAQLSPAQMSDVFRGAGFSPAESEGYTRVLTRRIADLNALAPTAAVSADRGPEGTTSAAAEVAATRCLESTCRLAPIRETLTAISLRTPYARAIVGGFEQGAGVGGGVQVTTADAIPAVQLRAAALTSTARYRRFDLEAFFPHIRGTLNHADVWFTHLRRDTGFYGIGPRTPGGFETEFETVQRSYQGSLYRDLTPRLQGGLYAQVMSNRTSRGSDATVTSIDDSFSNVPGDAPARWIPGFDLNPRILSYGGFVVYDTRDNSVGLTRGLNLYGRVASAEGVGHQLVSGRYGWVEQELDARGYLPLGSPRTSLLLRARAQLKTPRSGDRQIPFYNLSWLGGRQYVRGFHSYRFRGNHVLLFSTEVQQTVYAMTSVRGIDAFAFEDTGQVWGDARSSTDPEVLDNQAFGSRNWHSGLGGGLQYRHSRSIAARVDVARSPEGTEIYASLSRGF